MTTTCNLHPSMAKADMDKFLVAAFAVKENPYSVEELFDAAQDPVAWPAVLKVLALEHDCHGEQTQHARRNKSAPPSRSIVALPRGIATWQQAG